MGQGAKILLVDDDLDLLEALRIILESKGYTVTGAADGDAALAAARHERPDLIVLDIMMRRKTEGFGILHTIRGDPALMYVPVLLATAITQRPKFRFAPSTDGEFLPADDYMEKPIDPGDLLKRVEKLLRLGPEQINVHGRKSIL